MIVAILHNPVPEQARVDEQDVLVQVEAISSALSDLGHEPVSTTFSLNMEEVIRSLKSVSVPQWFSIWWKRWKTAAI